MSKGLATLIGSWHSLLYLRLIEFMSRYEQIKKELLEAPKTWLVTGVVGFIGSNLLGTLLRLNQRDVGLGSFIIGHQHNLDEVRGLVSCEQWNKFTLVEGDIRDCKTYSGWVVSINPLGNILAKISMV